MAQTPFGYALRAVRDSPLRAEAIGIDARRTQWLAFAWAGGFAGLAGGLYAFSKGSISPETLAIPRSVDALVMALLGGVDALAGPLLGAAVFTWLQDTLPRATEYWRAIFGVGDPGAGARVSDRHRRRRRALARTRDKADERSARLRCSRSNICARPSMASLPSTTFQLRPSPRVKWSRLIGPNGAGKTTCFNLINGQLKPDAGEVRLAGERIDGLPPRRIAALRVGRTFQTAAVFASMTVRENVQLALLAAAGEQWGMTSLASRARAADAEALLERVGAGALGARTCATLAYGDLKRVEIAIALATAPRLLLMDEPTAGTSPRTARN